MNKPVTIINGTEYPLATTLRVAYEAQGCNNHKPYTEVFKSIGDMTLEKQLEILYISFKVANPELALTLTKQDFLNYYYDHFNLGEMMMQLQGVIKGITGSGDEDTEAEQPQGDSSTESEGN